MTASATRGARPSVGSSAMSTIGGSASAGARLSICCSPPERRPATCLRRSDEDREALVGVGAKGVVPQEHGEVLLDGEAGEDAAGLGDEQHAVARAPERLGVGDVLAARGTPCRSKRRPARRRPRTGWTCRRRWRRAARDHPAAVESQVDAVEDLDVAVAGDDAPHRERGVVGGLERDRVVTVDRGQLRAFRRLVRCVWCRSCSGTTPPCTSASAAAMRARRRLLSLPAQLLLAGEGEDAVGLLRELDGTEARQDRHEVDRRDERVARRRRSGTTTTRSSGRRGAGGEREAGEQRATGAADAEGHREREPEQPDERRRGRVAELEREHGRASRRRCRRSRRTGRRSVIFERLTAMPDASAATSELRTARIARPDDERIERVDRPA